MSALSAPAFAQQADDGYVGDEVCAACHDKLLPAYSETRHAKVLTEGNALRSEWKRGCEGCHGPGGEHVAQGGGKAGSLITFSHETPDEIDRGDEACMSCHAGGHRVYWSASPHDTSDVGCTSCHTVMHKESATGLLSHEREMETCGTCHPMARAQQFRNAHMPVREDKMRCSSCHNVHGTIADHLISEVTINDNCYRCHAEKRGPFLWEHPPVNEDCMNCHVPHGSTRANMLRLSSPRLCQQCHVGGGHPSNAQSPNSRFVLGSACQNCHLQIHGTNHPSGSGLTR